MQTRIILPLVLFSLLVILLWRGLALNPSQVPSPLINQPAPRFELPALFGPQKTVSNKDFIGHVTLFNVWATWCSACAEEHAYLVQLSKYSNIIFFGLNYKDNTQAATRWLNDHGNPYRLVAIDETGDTAIDWGVYGTPETFVLDKKGIIRYKHIGIITPDLWQQVLNPVIQTLQKEP